MGRTNLQNRILVGLKGNAHTNMQALAAFATEGFHAVFSAKGDPLTGAVTCIVSLYNGSELAKTGEGPTFAVALRRLFDGAGKLKPQVLTEERDA